MYFSTTVKSPIFFKRTLRLRLPVLRPSKQAYRVLACVYLLFFWCVCFLVVVQQHQFVSHEIARSHRVHGTHICSLCLPSCETHPLYHLGSRKNNNCRHIRFDLNRLEQNMFTEININMIFVLTCHVCRFVFACLIWKIMSDCFAKKVVLGLVNPPSNLAKKKKRPP